MDGQETALDVQNQTVDSQAQAPSEPVDLTQAFQMLRESNKETTEAAEPETTTTEPVGDSGANIQSAVQPVESASSQTESYVPDSNNGSDDLGGSSASQPGNDYASAGQGIINRVREQARQEVLNEFKDHNIRLIGINDIYERSDDGTVKFNNPDDPRHPFASRTEAQAWVDSMNAQINTEYQNRIAKRAGELWQEAQPEMQVIQFAPYYERMDATTQGIFDQLIEPYSVMRDGKLVGFNCNLAAMANQAIKIVQSLNLKPQINQQQQQTQQQKPENTTPAMDMKSGVGESSDNTEPKDINEAMMILQKQRKEKEYGKEKR